MRLRLLAFASPLLCLALLALCGRTAQAAPAAPAESSTDELAIRRAAHDYVKAFEKGDAKALAALWAPKAVYINSETGQKFEGRSAIEGAFRDMFKKSGSAKIKVSVQQVRLVAPTVGIEDGVATVIRADEEPSESSYTAVYIKQDGKWLIDSVRETELPPPPGATEHLEPLAWLIGKWVDQDDDADIHSTYAWTANKAFITHAFTVRIGDQINLRGMQIIAWDPAAKRIRSWAFDSTGGFAEGKWRQDGDRWIIQSDSTLADGKKGSAVNVLKKVDDDHYTWKSSARQIDGEMQPNIDEVPVVREELSDEASSDKAADSDKPADSETESSDADSSK
ncbi:MAG: SgcJ/EcaC family oxidoreductase [Planctomycetia bacterium]|nr:SgcJ/EcaC family oxidoreductase [Planctomycetia bacterium]